VASLNQPPTPNKAYCAEQGLGQHMGIGVVSATAAVVPRVTSKSVVTTILRMVFFMFFSCGELGSVHRQKHSRCLPPGEDKIGVFQSSEVVERLWDVRLGDTPMCQIVG
jgi:hypothetical protein